MNKYKPRFQRKILAVSVASCLASLASGGVFAQAPDDERILEEVIVTGLRASTEKAVNIKRDSFGVVDAITADDIGKFPDTNLAESLQRIAGVSIERQNGEGTVVTVRGFGAENNMVTLNGRMMPAARAYGGNSGAGGSLGNATRAFDFSNLASESISAVEVFKTSRADIASGGIGATIDVRTVRPLEQPGTRASVGIKALNDTTNRTGSDITPEVSGLFSWTDDDQVFGVALTGSYQERDSGSTSVAENQWNIGRWGEDQLYSFTPDAVIENAPAPGQLYARPNDLRYAFSDFERTRTNGQLTLQWQPIDSLRGTVDYTFAEQELLERRGESTSWLANGNSIDHVIFDSGSKVVSPLYIHETNGPRDQGFEQQLREQVNTLESAGLNLEWHVTDRFSLTFDAHDSSMESLPDAPGGGGEIAVSMGVPIQIAHALDFRPELPLYTMDIDDCIRGNCNDVLDAGDNGSQVVRIWYSEQTTDITQFRLDGALEFDNGRFDFGVESREMEMRERQSDRYMAMGDWSIANPGDIPVDMVDAFNLSNFDDYSTKGGFQGGLKGNAEDIGQYLVDLYGTAENGYTLAYNPSFSDNNKVQEDTQSIYFQFSTSGELGGMETNLRVGLRYETTDVTSTSLTLIPAYLLWQDNNDFQVYYPPGTDAVPFSQDADYDNLLPSLDFDLSIREDLKARFSYSKTIARANYSDLRSSVSNFGSGQGSTLLGAVRTADAANPALLPLESDNFDVSVEWYFDEASFVSVGWFEKRVKNFIGTEKVNREHFGILDQTNGPRVRAAAQALQDRGFALDDSSLFTMTAILDNPGAFPNGADTYDGTLEQQQAIATKYDVATRSDDPVSVWLTSQPVNNREATIYGFEIAGQHWFGETGFGIAANYTIVNGDVGYNDGADPGDAQFALLGLSDTANLIAMYEKYGFQVRLAWNWRDEYLRSSSEDTARNPIYVEAYDQLDLSVAYSVNDSIQVFFEGLNITEENRRDHGRSDTQIEYLEDLGARYLLGARYVF